MSVAREEPLGKPAAGEGGCHPCGLKGVPLQPPFLPGLEKALAFLRAGGLSAPKRQRTGPPVHTACPVLTHKWLGGCYRTTESRRKPPCPRRGRSETNIYERPSGAWLCAVSLFSLNPVSQMTWRGPDAVGLVQVCTSSEELDCSHLPPGLIFGSSKPSARSQKRKKCSHPHDLLGIISTSPLLKPRRPQEGPCP